MSEGKDTAEAEIRKCDCGSDARLTTNETDDLWFVECNNDNCMKFGPERFTPTSAVNGWNHKSKNL